MEADILRKALEQQGRENVSAEASNPQEIFSWKAPLRAYKKKSAGVMRFYIALGLLLSLVVFFLGEKILVLPIWAIFFLVYVLTITPPPIIENKITKFGIETAGVTYRWEGLSHFYFVKKFDYNMVVVVSRPPYFSRVYLILQNVSGEKIISLLSEHLVYQEKPLKTFSDRLAENLTKLMPEIEDEQGDRSAAAGTPAGSPL